MRHIKHKEYIYIFEKVEKGKRKRRGLGLVYLLRMGIILKCDFHDGVQRTHSINPTQGVGENGLTKWDMGTLNMSRRPSLSILSEHVPCWLSCKNTLMDQNAKLYCTKQTCQHVKCS